MQNETIVQIYLMGEVAILDVPLPITLLEKAGGGHYTLAEYETLNNIRHIYSTDGTEVVVSLDLKYLESEKDAIELALGDNLGYAFLGWRECDNIAIPPKWPENTNGTL